MPLNGHLEWLVNYKPGVLIARGFRENKIVLEKKIGDAGNVNEVRLIPDRESIKADGEDVSVITVQAADANGVFCT